MPNAPAQTEPELKLSEEEAAAAAKAKDALTRRKLSILQAKVGEYYRLRGRLGSRAARRKADVTQQDLLTWQLIVARYEHDQKMVKQAVLGETRVDAPQT